MKKTPKKFDPSREALLMRERLLKIAAKWPADYRGLLAVELRNASRDIDAMAVQP